MSEADRVHELRHELRTPVNQMVGYGELLLEEDGLDLALAKRLKTVVALARESLDSIASVLNEEGAVSSEGTAILDRIVAGLEEVSAGLPAAHPRFAHDLTRIRQAAGRLRELVGTLQSEGDIHGPQRETGKAAEASHEREEVILVVDDDEANREVLVRRLQRLGHATIEAEDGFVALGIMHSRPVALVLLDLMMPGIDGLQVLTRMKREPELRSIPVIMISAVDESESIIRCIEEGAEDYLPRPFDPVLLKARVGASLEKKRLRDKEHELLRTVTRQAEELQAWNEELSARVEEKMREVEKLRLLQRFVSPQLAEIIAAEGEAALGSHRREITVLFCDLRGFTPFSETAEPEDVMSVLADLHQAVGPLIFAHQGTLAQFTGDGIMVFFNDPIPCDDPAWQAVQLALEMRERAGELSRAWMRRGYQLELGVGVSTGHATCGRIGFEGRYEYTAIGTVTNLAARLCGVAAGGQILITERTLQLVEPRVQIDPLGPLDLKGLTRPVQTYALLG